MIIADILKFSTVQSWVSSCVEFQNMSSELRGDDVGIRWRSWVPHHDRCVRAFANAQRAREQELKFLSHDLMRFERRREERRPQNIKADVSGFRPRNQAMRISQPVPKLLLQSRELDPVICDIHTEQVVPILPANSSVLKCPLKQPLGLVHARSAGTPLRREWDPRFKSFFLTTLK